MMTIHLQKKNTTPSYHKYPIGKVYCDKRNTRQSLIRSNGGPPKGGVNIIPLRGNRIPIIPTKKQQDQHIHGLVLHGPLVPCLVFDATFFNAKSSSQQEIITLPTYTLGTNLNIHVQMFHKAIHANPERIDTNIIYLFCFTFQDVISKWGKYCI